MADPKLKTDEAEYGRKRSYLQTLITRETGLLYKKDFSFLKREKVKRSPMNRLFIICLKGSSTPELNKEKISKIFTNNELETRTYGNKLVVLLKKVEYAEISENNNARRAPVVDVKNPEFYEKRRHAVEIIKNLHWLHGIIGVPEKILIDYDKQNTINFVYFSGDETEYAMNFFLNNGFELDLQDDPIHKIAFSLDIPQSTTWPDTIGCRPFGFLGRSDTSKIMGSVSTRLKLVAWEIKNRFRCSLSLEGNPGMAGRGKSSRFKSTCHNLSHLFNALKFLEDAYGIQSERDRDEDKSFFVLDEVKEIIHQKTEINMSEIKKTRGGKKTPEFNQKIYDLLIGEAGFERYLGTKKCDPKIIYLCVAKKKGEAHPKVYFRGGEKKDRVLALEKVKTILTKCGITHEYSTNKKTAFYVNDGNINNPSAIKKQSRKRVGKESTGIHKDVYELLLPALGVSKYSQKNDPKNVQIVISNKKGLPHPQIEFLAGNLEKKQKIAQKAYEVLNSSKNFKVKFGPGVKKTMLYVWYKKAEPAKVVVNILKPQKKERKSWVIEMYNALPEVAQEALRESILTSYTLNAANMAEKLIVLLTKNFHFVKKGSPAEAAINSKMFSSRKEIEDLIFGQ